MLNFEKDKMENKRKGFFIEDILLNFKEKTSDDDEDDAMEMTKTFSGKIESKVFESQSDLFPVNIQDENELVKDGCTSFKKYDYLQDKFSSNGVSNGHSKQTDDKASCSQINELTTSDISWTIPTNVLPMTSQVHSLQQTTNFVSQLPTTGQQLASLLHYNPAEHQFHQLSQLVNKHNHRHFTSSHLSHLHQSNYPHTPKTRKRDKKMRRPRTNFSDQQLRELEGLFTKQKYLNVQERTELAEKLGLNEMQIKTWYQNRRTKWKRQTQLSLDMLSQTMQQQRNMYQNTDELFSTNPGQNSEIAFPLIKPSPISLVNVISSDQTSPTASAINRNFSSMLNFGTGSFNVQNLGTDRLHVQSGLLYDNRSTTV